MKSNTLNILLKKALFALLLLDFCSCAKDVKPKILGGDLLSFSVDKELYQVAVDPATKILNVVIPHTISKTALRFKFTLSPLAKAAVNGHEVVSEVTQVDCSTPQVFTISSADSRLVSKWTLIVQSDVEYEGLGSLVRSEKSLARSYDFYIDQFDNTTWQFVNCGPAVTTMAIKWADSTFTGTTQDARNQSGLVAVGGIPMILQHTLKDLT